jgi:two-component system OmpR family sensor kinase
MKDPDSAQVPAAPDSRRAARSARRLLWGIPLGWQLSVLYTLLLAVTLGLVGLLVYTQQQDFLVQDAATRLQEAATRISAGPSVPPDGGGASPGAQNPGGSGPGPNFRIPDADLLLRSLSGPDVTVAIRDTTGTVITSTQAVDNASQPVVDPVRAEQITSALAGNAVHWIAQRSDGSRRVVVLMSMNVRNQPGTPGSTGGTGTATRLLEQSASLAAADAATNRLGTYLLLGVLGGTIAGLVLGMLFTRIVLRPLEGVVVTAEAIADGDLQRRVQLPPGRNEVARLGSSFDHMVGRLVAALEAQRRFVADASHELRTPLTSLKGLAEILMIGAHGGDSRVIEQSAQAINGELERLIRLVTDLLILSRLDSAGVQGGPPARRTKLDVCTTLNAAAVQMGVLAEARNVRLVQECPGPLWIDGDPGQLKQVLLNLVDNALRHTPAGGEVALRGKVEAGMARLDVQDTGSGIDARDLPRIFDRFYRGDTSRSRSTGNTGLGLAIARTIVEGHGGKIEVQSAPGEGTCFTIRLPLVRGSTSFEEPAQPQAAIISKQ